MNKQKRSILRTRARAVKKVAEDLQDPNHPNSTWTKEQGKHMTLFYRTNVCLPSTAKDVIKKMKDGKLSSLLFKLRNGVGPLSTFNGYCFEEKLIMCCFVSGKNWKKIWAELSDFYNSHPSFQE